MNDSELRMKLCISMLPSVPLGLLFTFGPKLQIDGYRWSRSLFQNEQIDSTSTQIPRDERGLVTTTPGIFLSHFTGYTFSEESHYQESVGSRKNRWIYRVQLPDAWEENYPTILTRLGDPNLKLAVVVGGTSADGNAFTDGIHGVLVSICSEGDDDSLICRYECGVYLNTLKEELALDIEIIGSCVKTDKTHHQKWNIG